jgi:hypothetical protein
MYPPYPFVAQPWQVAIMALAVVVIVGLILSLKD